MTGTIKRWAVADGRTARGIIELAADGSFVAIAVTGEILGQFDTCREAARAFEHQKE